MVELDIVTDVQVDSLTILTDAAELYFKFKLYKQSKRTEQNNTWFADNCGCLQT